MSALKVTAYNVKFGDAILVAVPEGKRGSTVIRHILIDVGNVLAGPARTPASSQRWRTTCCADSTGGRWTST